MEIKILKSIQVLFVIIIVLTVFGLSLDIYQSVQQNKRDHEVQFHY